MTRFQKLAATSVVMTLLLVTIGVIVRATDSGMGCPDWPLCHGQIIPPLDDPKAWIEWIHRTVAAAIGFVVLALAFVAFRDHRDRPSLLWPSIGVVALVGFQAWLGRETVRLNNSGESVTAHLAAAMALLGLLVFILVRSFYPARIGGRGGSQRFTLVAALAAVAVFALLLFGSQVTATSQWYAFPDWPLMNGSLFPPLDEGTSAHVLHRWVAIVVGLIVAAVVVVAWRTQRENKAIVRLALVAGVLYPDPGGRRRAPDPDRPLGLDADAPRRARRADLGGAGGARVRQLLLGPHGAGPGPDRPASPARRSRAAGRPMARRASSPGPAPTRCVPTSRSRSRGSSSCCS